MNTDVEANGTEPDAPFGDELPGGTELLQGQYTIERFLNAGGFGITYLAHDSLERKVVIKECFPSSMCCRRKNAHTVQVRSRTHAPEFTSIVKLFSQEARALSKLKHPNIVGVHQVFEDNDTVYMALDFVEGQDLLDIIEGDRFRFSPDDIKRILMQLLSAVAFIHDNDILHRDISPDNILIDADDKPVLIDFGAAREEATRASRVLSALHMVKDGYSPQEFYIAGSTQTLSSDLYALAATFYHLITGEAPPNSQTRLAAVAEDNEDPYKPITTIAKGYDQFFLGAIDKALAVFPKDRLQSAHEWIEEVDEIKRRKAMAARAKRDKQMEHAIGKLVNETNQAVEEDEATEKRSRKRRIVSTMNGGGTDRFPTLNDADHVVKQKTEKSQGPPQKRSILDRVFNMSLWRAEEADGPQPGAGGKVDR